MTATATLITVMQTDLLAVHVTGPPSEVSSIWMWVASVAIVAVTAAIGFKNAKRTHQD